MELFDSHVHFFKDGYQSGYGSLFPNEGEIQLYEKFRKTHRIRAVLAVGYEGKPYRGNNTYLGKIAARHRWVHPLAYCVPGRPPTLRQVGSWLNRRFAGISLYILSKGDAPALSKWPPALLENLNRRRAIVSVNVPCGVIPFLRSFFESLPGCSILLSHLGLPGVLKGREHASKLRPVTCLARMPHVGLKASGFYACEARRSDFPHRASHPIFKAVHDAFGPGRLYWGSDFSPVLEYTSFAQTIEILDRFNLSEADRRAILGENLKAVLNGIRPSDGQRFAR